MKKSILALALCLSTVLGLCACGNSAASSASAAPAETAAAETETAAPSQEPAPAEGTASAATEAPDASAEETAAPAEQLAATTVYIDIAASLEAVFTDVIIPAYKEVQPNVTIEYSAGSSGKLLAGIEEANGIGHDLFFSAGKAQVTTLNETDGLVVDGSIVNLLANELCLVKGNNTETEVTGWDTLNKAKSMALCGGSVPVGKYSRIALIALGVLPENDDPASITTEEISTALGGIEIDEADDVEVAAAKAVEGAVDVATIYYSDYYNHQDDLTIIAQDDGTLTGAITYPVCLVKNPEADEAESAAAADFLEFLQTEQCLKAYEEYCFIVNK